MDTSPEVRRPINLKLGRQRVKLGYEVRRPDGTTILAPAIPGLGLHGSLHPSGLLKISDRLGFDRRLDLRSPALLATARSAAEELVENLLASVELNPEFDEDVIALGNPNLTVRPFYRTSRFGIDIDPLAALRPPGVEFPFVYVDEDAIPQYVDTVAPTPAVLFAPESHRAIFVPSPSKSASFVVDMRNPLEFVRGLPFGEQVLDAFEETIDHLRTLKPTSGVAPFDYLRDQFERLDQDALVSDFAGALSGSRPPVFRRFTSEGFKAL